MRGSCYGCGHMVEENPVSCITIKDRNKSITRYYHMSTCKGSALEKLKNRFDCWLYTVIFHSKYLGKGERDDIEVKKIEKELEKAKEGTRCLSDRVLNYMQFLFKKLGLEKKTQEFAIKLYKDLRVDGYFGMRGNPRSHAGAIVYISAIKNDDSNQITQSTISYYLNVAVSTIMKSAKNIRRMENKND